MEYKYNDVIGICVLSCGELYVKIVWFDFSINWQMIEMLQDLDETEKQMIENVKQLKKCYVKECVLPNRAYLKLALQWIINHNKPFIDFIMPYTFYQFQDCREFNPRKGWYVPWYCSKTRYHILNVIRWEDGEISFVIRRGQYIQFVNVISGEFIPGTKLAFSWDNLATIDRPICLKLKQNVDVHIAMKYLTTLASGDVSYDLVHNAVMALMSKIK